MDCLIPWEVDLSYVRRTADYESKSKDSTQLPSMVPASVPVSLPLMMGYNKLKPVPPQAVFGDAIYHSKWKHA